MKDLILVRHAKSSWEFPVKDQDRPLKDKGILSAKKTSKYLNNQLDFTPQLWLSSDANRALHTATMFAQEFNTVAQLRVNPDLYTFSQKSLSDAIHKIDNQYQSAILFGHNGAITDFANSMGDKLVQNVPTAGVVYIRFNTTNWAQLTKGSTQFIIIPKQI